MNDIIKFCERLETSSYIFNYKGNASHPKNPISPLLATNRSLCQTMLHTNLWDLRKMTPKLKLTIMLIPSLPAPCMAPDTIWTRVTSCRHRPNKWRQPGLHLIEEEAAKSSRALGSAQLKVNIWKWFPPEPFPRIQRKKSRQKLRVLPTQMRRWSTIIFKYLTLEQTPSEIRVARNKQVNPMCAQNVRWIKKGDIIIVI